MTALVLWLTTVKDGELTPSKCTEANICPGGEHLPCSMASRGTITVVKARDPPPPRPGGSDVALRIRRRVDPCMTLDHKSTTLSSHGKEVVVTIALL